MLQNACTVDFAKSVRKLLYSSVSERSQTLVYKHLGECFFAGHRKPLCNKVCGALIFVTCSCEDGVANGL